MRARGEAIQGELATLKAREDGLMQGQASPVMQANTDKRLEQIANADKASAAFWAWLWLIIMLCTLEGSRSLSLWAYITDISAKDANLDRQRSDELAELRHQNELAALAAQRVTTPPAAAPPPPVVEPVATPEPIAAAAPEPEPEPLELTQVAPPEPAAEEPYPTWRPGIMAANHARAAKKAREEAYIVVPSLVARDQSKQLQAAE